VPTEKDIVYESKALFVLKEGRQYLICRHSDSGTHSIVCGKGLNKDTVIRCAKRLEMYPKQLAECYPG